MSYDGAASGERPGTPGSAAVVCRSTCSNERPTCSARAATSKEARCALDWSGAHRTGLGAARRNGSNRSREFRSCRRDSLFPTPGSARSTGQGVARHGWQARTSESRHIASLGQITSPMIQAASPIPRRTSTVASASVRAHTSINPTPMLKVRNISASATFPAR